MQTIKVKGMDLSVVAVLEPNRDWFYVLRDGVLFPAQLTSVTPRKDRELLGTPGGLPEGRFMPSVAVQTAYGVMFVAGADQLYVEDPAGEPMQLIETVGTQIGLTVYAPGLEGEDVLGRIRAALRSEFGPGFLQVRQETHRPVSEDGLPPVLGVPDGQIARLV